MVQKPESTQKPEFLFADEPVAYTDALAFMEARVDDIIAHRGRECVWFLEHPPIYTAGKRADKANLLAPNRFPVFAAGRGGDYTYHGPGQRVVYLMLDLRRRGRDLRKFVRQVEGWILAALSEFNVQACIHDDQIGVWVPRPELAPRREDKIAAIGLRVRRWVSFHGLALNVEPDLEHFSGIVPCGIADKGVTSLVDLGLPVSLEDADQALIKNFDAIFGTASETPTQIPE
jgi:lipoyl(octanoyl) transferase